MTSNRSLRSTRHLLTRLCVLLLLLLNNNVSPAMAFVLHHRTTHRTTLPPMRAPATHLQLSSSTAAAAAALTTSALSGMWMERRKPNSGILTSLAVSSLAFSRMAPSTHFLYDMCWNTFLPASLALLLLGMPQKISEIQPEGAKSTRHDDSIRTVVRRLALPFGLASLGSLMGCTVSFFLCRSFRSILWLSPTDAAWAGACLSASFVGGSVNFLATASWIASQATTYLQGAGRTTLLVSAMTAADLIVMAIYFAMMAAASQSLPLQRWFDRTSVRGDMATAATATTSSHMNVKKTEDSMVPTSSSSPTPSSFFHVPTALLTTTIAFALVRVGQVLEHVCHIPGTACAVLAAVTPWVSRYMPQQAVVTAPPLSQFCFFLLFAAVGVTADLGAALQSGPACLVFAAVALIVHGLVLLVGGRYVLPAGRVAFLDCLIASNAAIGGPATAATFCGTLKNNTQALTIAATIWGVFGYAIGTTVGVAMYRFLSLFV